MPNKIIVLIVLLYLPIQLISQGFSPQQQAWLYKIVRKTPCLKRNWNPHFTYTGGIPESVQVFKIIEGKNRTYYVSMWDSIEQSIIQNPDLLTIDLGAISKTSPGLIANASVKLALWELYSNIKSGYGQNPPFSAVGDFNVIHQEIVESLPLRMKKDGEVKEKFLPVFCSIINPSLSVKRKLESFKEVGKVSAQEKKKVFDRWHQLISSHISIKSEQHFNFLLKKEVYFKDDLLAAGDGSGSSGLLYEREDTEEGLEINTGTGKGIGLFTYKMKRRKEELTPEYLSETNFKTLGQEPVLLHFSLWGMDWAKKPLIVVEQGEKSYLLFGTPSFSPDHKRGKGGSYFDRLEDYKKRKIDWVLKELKKEGGLLEVYEREGRIRNQIQQQINSINLEVDSLQKIGGANNAAIQNRKFKNEVNLSNLMDKERRLADVQRKIGAQYSKIDKAEKELEQMRAKLGKKIQKWEKKDSIYVFEDGSQFHFGTQDLILFNDSNSFQEDVKVKLLAATYSVYSDSKDEVQLYVNATEGVQDYLKYVKNENLQPPKSDTLINAIHYFEPDEYMANSFFTTKELEKIETISKHLQKESKTIRFDLMAMGVDTLNHPNITKDQGNYSALKFEPKYKNARRAEIQLIEKDDEFVLNVYAYADAGRTRLSKLKNGKRKKLQQLKTEIQSLNIVLSALRVKSVFEEFGKIVGNEYNDQVIQFIPLDTDIKISDF